MKKYLFYLCVGFGFLASAQEKKKDSASAELKDHMFKPRLYYPSDCSCPGKVIYKEAKPDDKNFNPYQYKEIKVIKIDSFDEEDKKKILEQVYRNA